MKGREHMGTMEDVAMKITHAFEDDFFNKERREMFEVIFNRYLSMVDLDGADLYEAMLSLGRSYPFEFEQMVKAFKDKGLISQDSP